MMKDKHIYKIQFIHQDKVYEVYARSVGPSGIMGFIEIGELIFGEKTSLLVDPGEESLKNEFSGVRRSYIPIHCVIRIDEVARQGQAKIRQSESEHSVHPFPAAVVTPPKPETSS